MKETNNTENNISVVEVLTKSEQFLEQNRKPIVIGVAVVALIVVAIFGLRYFYFQPREKEASEEMFVAENLFAEGLFEQALNGDSVSLGFLDIIDNYGGTKAGNLARYHAGICQLQLGQYDEALKLLKKYKGRDLLTPVEAEMLCGDAEAELENYSAALRHYKKAADMNPNVLVTPTARMKAAQVMIHEGEYSDAVEMLESIRRDYPESTEANEVDKFIGYAEAKK